MSRIIVKNFPKFVSEKELKEHFQSLGQITDCRVARHTDTNESRRFGFIGFKDVKMGRQAKKKYDNTYFGVSKIKIDFAKTETEQEKPQQKKKQKGKKEDPSTQKFNEYKKVVIEGIKKSWDDLVLPEGEVEEEPKKTKRQKMKEKKQRKIVKKEEKSVQQDEVKPIKAPKFTEKNKKYISKPLTIDQSRLYITNIPYNLTQDELRKGFQKYGVVKKVKLPLEYDGKAKGFAFVTYDLPEEAIRAFHQLDNKVMFGRILHIKPAVEDIGSIIRNGREEEYEKTKKQLYGNTPQEKTSYKKRKKKQMRQKLNDTTSWNTLFLNPNTVLERVSDKLNMTKSEILLSDNLAPKIALAEAEVIQQTKEWMVNSSVNVDFLTIDRDACQRSKKVLLLKNLNYRVSQHDLLELMNFYGVVNKLLLAPNRSIAIVEYQNGDFAKSALEKLQNSKFKNNFLYLQYAPVGMLKEADIDKKIEEIEEEKAEVEEISKVVYVKNLNFSTDQQSLSEFVQKQQHPESVTIIRNKTGKSMGYGFVQFKSNQQAQKVIKKLQNNLLDNHRILLSVSKKRLQTQNYDKIKELKEKMNKTQKKSHKLVVRNLAFQATRNDVREIFKHYGSLKSVRLPKKMNGQHRGFGFVEFDTGEEAGLAKQALGSTHLYGRKLVIQYEKGENEK